MYLYIVYGVPTRTHTPKSQVYRLDPGSRILFWPNNQLHGTYIMYANVVTIYKSQKHNTDQGSLAAEPPGGTVRLFIYPVHLQLTLMWFE